MGFSYEVQNDEERQLESDLLAQGRSRSEIAAALQELRSKRRVLAEERRNTPGVVTVSKPLEPGGDDWLRDGIRTPNGAAIPGQVADRLRGMRFATFKAFREEFWRAVEATPELARGFNSVNRGRMRLGLAPFVPEPEATLIAWGWQLHHDPALAKGGPVYDISTIRVVTPRQHIRLHSGDGG